MKKRFLNVFVLTLFLGLCSCLEIKKKDSEPESSTTPPQVAQAPTSEALTVAKAELQALSELHQYAVKLPVSSWGAVKRFERGLAVSSLEFLEAGQANYIDSKVQEGKKYLYELGRFEDKRWIPGPQFEVDIPVDVQIDRSMTISEMPVAAKLNSVGSEEFFVFGRMHLSTGAVFITEGKTLVLSIGKLRSENGSIQSLSSPQMPALDGQIGQSAGRLSLNIRKAEGFLSIKMLGGMGGKGKAGQAYTERARRCKEKADKFPLAPCLYGPGQAGYAGEPGLAGGDSGKLFIKIENSEELRMEIEHIPGLGGLGGDGGPGQQGAAAESFIVARDPQIPRNGGGGFVNPGPIDINPPQLFPEGKKGEPGSQGPQGSSGQRGVTCVFMENQKYECK